MFFSLSKLFWLIADPGNFLLILLIVAVALMWTRWRRFGRLLAAAVVLLGVAITLVPVGKIITTNLENRFPAPYELPVRVDGVIVLGGVVDQFVSAARGQVATNGAVERLLTMGDLARRYPESRLIFTGGSGVLGHQDLKEAHYVIPVLKRLGIDVGRVIFEDQSRTTAENASLTRALAKPRKDQKWVLVTSAFHMPRAIGAFRKQGWNVIAYPVDFGTTGEGAGSSMSISDFVLTTRLGALRNGMHEFIGLFAYWLTDRSDSLYPAPRDND